ncbi:MAG: type II toxin-antitoxin system prevent-host-death family antitoxin [bacterium]|nr:type II toxin-antitoxin system prevent-host-death family antitoxin [bacterium]
MLLTSTSLRDLARRPKEIIAEVKKSKKAKVVMSKSGPQAVIVSLEDYQQLERAKAKQGSLEILKLALSNKRNLKSLPADLRQRANEILYSK